MIPKQCKRLAEVDFPIARVSQHAVNEAGPKRGHPKALHPWPARRPLASSRAMLLALLLPDPCDPHCPEPFKEQARAALLGMPSRPSGWSELVETDDGLRWALLSFIGDFANWDHAASERHVNTGRALVNAAHPAETPLVVDPFAGGGSIPLEALRLGCETFASDLNPVACLILKVMLEDIPRYGPSLADDLRKAGGEIKEAAERELADLFPTDADGATPIAYLWARTVRCEAPNCGAEIPLMRSFWLCRKPNRKWALRARVERTDGEPPRVEFDIFEPEAVGEVDKGTVAGGRATCPCCRSVLPRERVRSQLAQQRGGGDIEFDDRGQRLGGARMTAVVILRPGERGRRYRLPTDSDYAGVLLSQQRLVRAHEEWARNGEQVPKPVPDEPLNPVRPSPNARGLSPVTRYGMASFGDLFTSRQRYALVTIAQLIRQEVPRSPQGLQALTALCLNNMVIQSNSGCRWKPSGESVVDNFARNTLPMVWDFAESNPLHGPTGKFGSLAERIAQVVDNSIERIGLAMNSDAIELPLPDRAGDVWFTDPPYYDSIPYADLSDYFLVWLNRSLPGEPMLKDPFDSTNALSPKVQECVWNQSYTVDGRPKDAAFFEGAITKSFEEARRVLSEDGIGSVVFAHNSTEGWEALLSGMINSGWTITGSWPVATESSSRLNARETASLATSVHLVCRPRHQDAPVGDWADVLGELPGRVGDWMQRLQSEGIRGADLVFACVGPALEIYSRYSRVETPDGREVSLPEYLERVWEVVGREALEQVLGTAEAQARNGQAGALEEDSRLSALFLWTMQVTAESADAEEEAEDDAPQRRPASHSLPFDVVRRFAQPLGIHLDEWEDRIIETEKGHRAAPASPGARAPALRRGRSGLASRSD